jgi:large subunit ribosomal protein L3
MVKVDIFKESEIVNVIGTTKGKGFQGVVRRWHYAGGRATHGSMFHRAPGSIGSNTYPGRVFKGKGMPGRMGGKRRTIKGLEVVKVDVEKNLMMVKGAVPGFNGNYVLILKNSFKRR